MSQHLGAILTQNSYRCILLSRRHPYTSSTIHLRNHDSNDYSKTVFIPRSSFPQRHDPKIELSIQEDNQFAHTYLEQDPARKPYIIHDGPPFANGQIHLGHAINKILKDVAARYAMITGHKVEFITGWDCHGLPIELQVLKLIEEQQRQSNYGGSLVFEGLTSPEQFRAKARAYAKSQIDLQMASFKRMGLLTDWNKRYTTDDPSYVANQLRAFSKLYEQKLIFKDLMPVNWSLTNRTTIADADIDYRSDHISKSAYVLCEIIDPPFQADLPGQPFYALIWTTTPWTLLENEAIAFNKQETYCILKAWKTSSEGDTRNLLVSLDSLNNVQNLLQRLGYQCEMKTYLPGKSLIGLHYKPLLNSLNLNRESKPLPLLDAEFVDVAKGTGLVHLAPNYGHDDFGLFKKNSIPFAKGLVDTTGRYTSEAGNILAGKHVFSDGNQEILNILDQHQALLFTESTQHSYPYETRTNQPIMIRASQQIFLNTSMIIPRCVKALESVSMFPEVRKNYLINTLKARPNWCISRQRIWGTPIPVLYHNEDNDNEKMITHPQLVEHFCKLLYKKRFMDYWWSADNNELVPQELLDSCKLPYKSDELVRGTDIFDVWSDSGLSWHTTTNSLDDSKVQADLYLEGLDQIRGWFSASSILSMALRGCLPSKRFFLHGFALDEYGRKMSKSQGNVIDPVDLFTSYGVNPIRLWAARTAGANRDVHVNAREFKSSVNETINKIRLTLRYLIGALNELPKLDEKLDFTQLELFDQFYLDKLYRFASNVDEHYKSYRYDRVVATINKFIVTDLSPLYITTTKDILYCDSRDSKRRKSCLNVLNYTYNILLRCLYPIIPHIVYEASLLMKPNELLGEWKDLGYKAAWKNDVLYCQFETLTSLRAVLGRLLGGRFDQMRNYDSVMLISDKKLFKELVKITNVEPDLTAELFKTSTFILSHDDRLKQADDGLTSFNGSGNNNNNQDELEIESSNIKLTSSWIRETGHDLRVGGSLLMLDSGNEVKFEMCYSKSNNRKCMRCRRFAVLDVDEHANVCDRCKSTLAKLEEN